MAGYSHRAEWMSDAQFECAKMLADMFGGFHHLGKIKRFGYGIEMNTHGDLSTFDFSMLTTAVFMAHDRAIRFGVMASGPGMVKLVLHKRSRDGGMCERHPTLEEAIDRYNKAKTGEQ